jgi:hypothetical protein
MRQVIPLKSALVHGWGCSECAWAFNASGPPEGDSISEMLRNFERRGDQEFAAHVCAEHPRAKNEGRRTRSEDR